MKNNVPAPHQASGLTLAVSGCQSVHTAWLLLSQAPTTKLSSQPGEDENINETDIAASTATPSAGQDVPSAGLLGFSPSLVG
jgi:hypothetical protein